MDDLEKEIDLIKERNKRVESDKAWELSFFRKLVIAILTYILITLFFLAAGIEKPFVNALVPTVAFILSGLSLAFFKKIWLKYFYKK
ncbi:MAG: hypothetical protein WC310_02540 [Patescibacteria group bacterium]|jgi:hypothetical protein